MTTPPRYARRGTVARARPLVRAAVALAVLAGLLVGVPLALARFGDWPITHVPSWDQIRSLPSTGFSDAAYAGVLTVALWIGWALLAVSLLREIVAQARGRSRPGLATGPVQRLAAYLVGSLLMTVGPVAVPAGAWAARLPVVNPAATAGPVATAPAAGAPAPAEAALAPEAPAPVAAPATVVVRRGDSPWSLAETHLGDGMRWRELWEQNASRRQPGGQTWATPDAAIQPGWELALPAGITPATTAPAAGAAEVTVAPGDNFWSLAEEEVTAAWGRAPSDAEVAGHWQALVDTNRDALAPPGDPDLIYPGQTFAVPAVPADPVAAPAPAPAPAPAAPAPAPAPSAPAPNPAPAPSYPAPEATTPVPEVTAPAPEAPAATTPAPPAHPAHPAHPEATAPEAPTPPATAPPATVPGPLAGHHGAPGHGDQHDERRDLRPIGLAAGGVAVAGVLALLERRRRAQQRHRRAGRRVALPPPPLRPGEQALRAGADVDGAQLLDLALRAAASGSGATGLPRLRWVEAGHGQVLLVLAAPAPPPPGFAAVAADRWVTTAAPDQLAAVADHVVSPAPALLPVGTTALHTELLIDLETSGVATVTGPTDAALGLLRSLALAVATSPWSEQPRVVLVGLDGRLADLPWVEAVAGLPEALDRVEAHAAQVGTALRSLGGPTIAQARAAGIMPESWDPLVVVSAVPPAHPDEHRRLRALAERPHGAVVVVSVPPPGPGVGGRALTIDDEGWLRIDGVDVALQPRRLEDADTVAVTSLLADATRLDDVDPTLVDATIPVRRPPFPPPPAPPASAPVLDEGQAGAAPAPPEPAAGPGPRLPALVEDVEVVVRVLGDVVAVRRRGGDEEVLVPTRQRALEAIAYLALREGPVDRENLEISLFPSGANSAKTIYNTVSAARSLLGDELFPPTEGGRYELSPAVVTDYGLFCELVAEADDTEDAAAAADLLTEALQLVRGEPFTGVGRGYAWVGPHRGMIVAQVVDAAEELAEVRLATGDWRSAEWAARQGLRAFPADERLYRLLMRTARAAGNLPGVQRAFRELCDVVADPDLGVEPEDTLHPETVELLEELTASASRMRKGA